MEVNGHLPFPDLLLCYRRSHLIALERIRRSYPRCKLRLCFSLIQHVARSVHRLRHPVSCYIFGTVYEQWICEFSFVTVLSFHQALVLRPSYVPEKVGVNKKMVFPYEILE